ncbi:MAG: lipase family protein [Acidimicrobiales bacterium]
MSRRGVLALLVVTAVALGSLVVPWASSSSGATTISAFYTPPAPLPPGNHGALISYQTTTVNLGSGAPSVNAWDVMYYTEDALGVRDIATGTVLVPAAAWTGFGSRPVIDYAPGTQGLAQSCAPSVQLTVGTEYEAANLVALLNKGWAVVLTDYQGYTTGSKLLFTVGEAEGHAVLDMVTAADQVPGVGLSSSAPTAIWGYSQGGQAASWAGQLQPTYDPSLNLVGVAAGGIPANLAATATYLNGGPTAAFGAMSVIGLNNQYPSAIDLSSRVNAKGAAAIAAIENQCVFGSLLQFEHADLGTYTKNGETEAQLLATPAISSVVSAQQLGTTKIDVPVYQYHGQADEAIPLAQDIALKQQYCSEGVTDEFVLYPGEHVTTQFQAAPDVVSWIADRLVPFIGEYDAPNDCNDTAAAPTSTATPASGDWLINLNNWPVNAWVHMNSLDATVNLPSTTTFSGATDLSSMQLQNGEISAPTFTTTISAFGLIPLSVTFGLVQPGPATGSASIDANGDLHINASASATLQLFSLSFLGINFVDSTCQTASPVNFPLSYNGPVSSLGDGQLTLSGSTTFPDLTGCGALTGALNLLFPGAGQTFSFTLSPPAPTAY